MKKDKENAKGALDLYVCRRKKICYGHYSSWSVEVCTKSFLHSISSVLYKNLEECLEGKICNTNILFYI